MNHRTRLALALTTSMVACADDAAIDDATTDASTGTSNGSVTTLTTVASVSDSNDGSTAPTSSDTSSDSLDETTDAGSSDDAGTTEADTGSTGTDASSGSSGGPFCGDGTIDGTESCDDDDLGGANCAGLGQGFTDGALACATDCTFDVSDCTTCGDDTAEDPEDCDGDDLAGMACEDLGLGFVGGTLACDGACTFDVAACSTCGNDVVNGTEACDGPDLGGNGCIDLGMGFTAGSLACDFDCAYDTSGCSAVPWPDVGDLVITEIMQNPQTLPDTDGEYFEVYNPTLIDYQLGNCTIEGAVDAGFVVNTDLPIPALTYRVFATNTIVDQGFTADYQWVDAAFGLNNTTDTVRIVCDGVTVDEVAYDDGATFPNPNGQSMNLDSALIDAVANDSGANWCVSVNSYNGDFGTPGSANISCSPTIYPIDFCRLQFPNVINEIVGTDVPVFGRLFSGGLTDLSGVNDPAPEVIGYVGYGPDGSDPAVDATWIWVAGTPNAAYGPASPGYEANNDEYGATLTVPGVAGAYDFAFRFSGDGGATFSYCDGQAPGSSNGYLPADAGQMTASTPPPPPIYFSEYAEGSSSNKALEIYNASAASVDLDGCLIRQYFNGNPVAGATTVLAGSIAAGDVFVVCDDNIADPPFDPLGCDLLATGSFYNGNDAIELRCFAAAVDVIGQIGFDPGTEWNVGGVGTQNETLRRDCSVTAGDANGADAFDPSAEWASFAVDTFDDFGQYSCP